MITISLPVLLVFDLRHNLSTFSYYGLQLKKKCYSMAQTVRRYTFHPTDVAVVGIRSASAKIQPWWHTRPTFVAPTNPLKGEVHPLILCSDIAIERLLLAGGMNVA